MFSKRTKILRAAERTVRLPVRMARTQCRNVGFERATRLCAPYGAIYEGAIPIART
jgi:hypothetical protein